jgi:hypothetical protein
MRERGTHGLDLTVLRRELAQRAAPEQFVAGPDRPERHIRLAQLGDIHRMHAFRRRKVAHVAQVLLQQSRISGPDRSSL